MNLRARLLMFAIVLAVVGCRTEAERAVTPPPEAAWQPPPVPIAPEPAPVRVVDRALAPGLELRRPVVDGRLTLIPIIATRATATDRYITLGEGLAAGDVEITEVGELVVDTLVVHNRSARPLFVLQGELLFGGMQDRVIAWSKIIPAGARASLEVRCIEKGRSEGGPVFHAGRAIVELALRRAIAHETQNDVWAYIDAVLAQRALGSATQAYRTAAAAFAIGDSASRLGRILDELARREEHASTVGFAVAIDGELVALDRFATPALFAQFERQLLASYLADTAPASDPTERAAPPPPRPLLDAAAVRQFAASPSAARTPASLIILAERSDTERRATWPASTEDDG